MGNFILSEAWGVGVDVTVGGGGEPNSNLATCYITAVSVSSSSLASLCMKGILSSMGANCTQCLNLHLILISRNYLASNPGLPRRFFRCEKICVEGLGSRLAITHHIARAKQLVIYALPRVKCNNRPFTIMR